MNVLGHVAFAHAVAWRRRAALTQTQLGYAVVGSLLPDVVDKTLRLAGVFPWGRTVGHSAWVMTLAVLLAVLAKRDVWLWLVVGWVSHLFADLTDDVVCGIQSTGYVFATWYTWPYFNPDLNAVRVVPMHPRGPCLSVYETLTVVWVWAIAHRRRKRLSQGPMK